MKCSSLTDAWSSGTCRGGYLQNAEAGAWFWDPKLSGGGCLIDLGVHLVDLLLWMFDFPDVLEARGT